LNFLNRLENTKKKSAFTKMLPGGAKLFNAKGRRDRKTGGET
jgi:hypothetical protein